MVVPMSVQCIPHAEEIVRIRPEQLLFTSTTLYNDVESFGCQIRGQVDVALSRFDHAGG